MTKKTNTWRESITGTHNDLYWETDRNGRESAEVNDFAVRLDEEIKNISNLLKQKNKAYGNTALNPINVFSKLNASEAICARLDDKLARIKNTGINDKTEDTVDDLIGYLLLLKMSM
jgi:hypothetical protein|tara:strand:- start:3495 stop:3845 length:351 start_codon:yes stop_codon:yes gene_type:complete